MGDGNEGWDDAAAEGGVTLLSQEDWLEALESGASTVQVEGFQWHGRALLRHCRYRIVRRWRGMQVAVTFRRFSDFVALHDLLVRDHPFKLLPQPPEKVIASFRAGEALCVDRTAWCNAFLSVLLHENDECMLTNPWVKLFLCAASEEWQSRLEGETSRRQQQLVSQYKNAVSRIFHYSDTAAGASHRGADESDSKDSGQDAGSGIVSDSTHALKSLMSNISGKMWPTEDETQEKNCDGCPGWDAVRSAHARLCDARSPLVVYAPPLLDSSSAQQNVSVRIPALQGRLEATSRVSRCMLEVANVNDAQACFLNDLSESLEAMNVKDQHNDALLDEYTSMLRDLEKNQGQLQEALKNQQGHEILELFLRSSLTISGGQEVFERCVEKRKESKLGKANDTNGSAGLQAEHVQRETPEESRHLLKLAEDISRANGTVVGDLSTASCRLVEAHIRCAEENQKVLHTMLRALLRSEPDMAKKAHANRVRLGLTGTRRNVWNWDSESPL